MHYIFLRNYIYHYRRRIPKTEKYFTTSLHTDSLREAKKIANIITAKVDSLFMGIKMGEINYDKQMFELLECYKKEALREYSKLERLRHESLSFMKDGKRIDGGHPDAIKHWLKHLEEVIYNDPIARKKIYDEVLKRSGIKKSDITPWSKDLKDEFQFSY